MPSRKTRGRLLSPAQIKLLLDPQRWCVVSPLAPGAGKQVSHDAHSRWMRRHTERHQYPEVLFVLSGAGLFGWRDSIYQLKPGMCFVMQPSEQHDHGYRTAVSRGVHIWVGVLPSYALVHCHRPDPGFGRGRGCRWIRVLAKGEDSMTLRHLLEMGLEQPGQEAELVSAQQSLLQSALAALGAMLVRVCVGGDPPEETDSLQREAVGAVQEYVRETAGRGVSLDTMARIAGYSKHHFLRLFTKYAGMTPRQFIDVCRENRARDLLARGWTKKAIGEELGFMHASTFSRWERRHLH